MCRFLALFAIVFAVGFALVGSVPTARAVVFTVPSEATPTIASATLATAYGDTIKVLPGVYFESGIAPFGDTLRGVAGPAATTIDAQGQGNVLFASDTVIERLTITGGAAFSGAGIEVEFGSGSLTVRDCVVTENHATSGAAESAR